MNPSSPRPSRFLRTASILVPILLAVGLYLWGTWEVHHPPAATIAAPPPLYYSDGAWATADKIESNRREREKDLARGRAWLARSRAEEKAKAAKEARP